MNATSILVVEDEETLAESLRYNLTREGYEVTVVDDGRLALDTFRAKAADLVVLDLMLPGLGGFDVLRQIRASSEVPVVVVTAKDSEPDVVAGLELGADDYVTKPFSMRELMSRISANLRRASRGVGPPDSLVLDGGPVVMDVDRHEVRVNGALVGFRPKEFDLLEALLLRKGRLVHRQVLLEDIWGVPFFGDPKTLDVHIRRLRERSRMIRALQNGSSRSGAWGTSSSLRADTKRRRPAEVGCGSTVVPFWTVPCRSATTPFSRAE